MIEKKKRARGSFLENQFDKDLDTRSSRNQYTRPYLKKKKKNV